MLKPSINIIVSLFVKHEGCCFCSFFFGGMGGGGGGVGLVMGLSFFNLHIYEN